MDVLSLVYSVLLEMRSHIIIFVIYRMLNLVFSFMLTERHIHLQRISNFLVAFIFFISGLCGENIFYRGSAGIARNYHFLYLN